MTDIGDLRDQLQPVDATPRVRIAATYPPASRVGVLPAHIEIEWEGTDALPDPAELDLVIAALAAVPRADTTAAPPPAYGEAFGSGRVPVLGREGA
jgi:hypothetical protein